MLNRRSLLGAFGLASVFPSLFKPNCKKRAEKFEHLCSKGRTLDNGVLLLSPEVVEDIRSWNVDQVDEFTNKELKFSCEEVS